MNHTTRSHGGRRMRHILVALAALTLLAAACGDDDDSTSANGDTTTTGATGTTADISAFDANGDGEVRIGIAAAGPADDGAYYQAVVDANTDQILGCAILGMLQCAFPFEHSPALVVILRELGKDAAEIDLPVAQ